MRVRVCQRQREARRVCQEQESVMCRGNDVEEMRNGGKHDRAGEKALCQAIFVLSLSGGGESQGGCQPIKTFHFTSTYI